MKILQVVPVFSDPFGGPVTLVRTISKELAKRHEVTVYTTTAKDPKHDSKPRTEKKDGYQVTFFPRTLKQLSYSYVLGQLNLSLDMMQSVRKNLRDFDIIHVHSYEQFPDILINKYATKYDVPYILQPHGSIPKTSIKYRKILYSALFGSKVLRDASKIIALSKTEAIQVENAGVPKERIVIIPNSLDLNEYIPVPSEGSFKKKFGIPENMRIILYLGRIHKSKGIDLLVRAFAFLIAEWRLNDLLLVIAGPDDGFQPEVKSLVKSFGLSNSVLFTSFISNEDKKKALREAVVFVTPSFYGFPMTFLESCAIGTPIVTTTRIDTLEWIDNNVGFSSKPTYLDLGRAIYKIISDDMLRENFSHNCKLVMESHFSVERVVKKLEQVYEQQII